MSKYSNIPVTLNDLNEIINSAIEIDMKYIGVKIKMQGFEKAEVIINQSENFKTKQEYYNKAYNEDLALKTFSGIRIVNAAFGNSFSEIESKLFLK
jgi:hypothetical protein